MVEAIAKIEMKMMVASDPAKKAVILSLKLFNYFVQKLIIYIYFVLACLCSHTYTEFFCGCEMVDGVCAFE